ncbi:hypothetical protein LINPERPRIM_LOCUS39026, partial [Linum perenne]
LKRFVRGSDCRSSLSTSLIRLLSRVLVITLVGWFALTWLLLREPVRDTPVCASR